MTRRLRTWICFLVATCIIFGIFTSFNNLDKLHSKSTQLDPQLINEEYTVLPKNLPKNIFIFLKNTNSSIDCLIEHIVREYVDYKIYIYFDPTLNSEQQQLKSMETLTSAYNNIFIKKNQFSYEKFLETNFTQHSRLQYSFVSRLKGIIAEGTQTIDKQFIPMLDLWQNGGLYFSVNVTYDLIERTRSIHELFTFFCEQIIIDNEKHSQMHKLCKINFIKVDQFDCIVELAIKNYLLYFEKHKMYNFNRMFMNLYNNQNKILSKKNKISQNQYLTCFKSKLKNFRRQLDTLEHLFMFRDTNTNTNSNIILQNEDNCPLINSVQH